MSKIEVNTITQQCGPTLTVGGGACKSVTVDATTVTIGKSGGTVTLACGATQSGFGQTYSATSYCTTVKTSPFTAVAGKGYFVNTTCGAVTVTLPASPSAGDTVSVADYAGTWGTNNLTVGRNSSKIGGQCNDAILNSSLQSLSLIYIDGTQGWKTVNDATVSVNAPDYIVATGGTITCCGNYRIHTFTSDGCFSISTAPTPSNNNVDYLVVAGGGNAGPVNQTGGGGAGGYRESHCATVSGCYTASPLATPTSLPVSVQSYPITVGAGGGGSGCGSPGSASIFSTITSAGGGRGGKSGGTEPFGTAQSGGSGGGGGEQRCGNAGNTPPTSPPQGNPGGNSVNSGAGAGGGGASASGGSISGGCNGGAGGNGATTSISAISTTYAGGGGGGANNGTGGTGGSGGGGPGGNYPAGQGNPGTINTGGGGGGGAIPASPTQGNGSGGSGIVIIRYKFQ